ncbi:MAG: UDP-N-acetylmuramate--L-alanine ligase [Actinomycetes bacterium]
MSRNHFHFIGIGGAGMSGIARIMLAQGKTVSGSDAKESAVTSQLATLGATIYLGHSEANQMGADVVVVSTAIAANNPELIAAQSRSAEIMRRAEALALVMEGKRSIAVAGTHGKTTTTSMLTVALQRAALDPSFAIGGMINMSGTNAHLGTGDIFVAEADESDGSFLAYKPSGAIITNLELDHVDHFPTFDVLAEAFLQFISTIKPDGFLVACGDDENVRALLSKIDRTDLKVMTYGSQHGDNDFQLSRIHLSEGGGVARITHKGSVIGDIELAIPGAHNLLNAAAALAAGIALGAQSSDLLKGLSEFTGARRRFELKGEVAGIRIVDDYGHHPTEVRVTLETARRYAGNGKLFVIFQPHRYTRTQIFAQQFGDALNIADQIYLLEVYAASESPIPGVSSLLIAQGRSEDKFHYQPSMIEIIHQVTKLVEPGDVIITLGAGDVNSIAPVMLEALGERFG